MRFRFLYKYLALSFILYPQLSQGLSETELETLESSGTRAVSKSPWRREIGTYLSRNLEVETEYQVLEASDDSIVEASLFDPSNLYYGYNFSVYYSLNSFEKFKNLSFLKQTELFVSSGFSSNFAGGVCVLLADYLNEETGQITLGNYIRCGLEDISGGFTSPIYSKNQLYMFLSGSLFRIPISRRSQLVTLRNTSSASLSTLYFFKQDKYWSFSVSSSHSAGYSYFKSIIANKDGSYNRPLSFSNGLSFIVKQKISPYLPNNLRFSSLHRFALNTYQIESEECSGKTFSLLSCGSREHYLSLRASSSWRLPKRIFLSLSVSWRDLLAVSNPIDDNVFSSQRHSFGWHRWYLTTNLSYSF